MLFGNAYRTAGWDCFVLPDLASRGSSSTPLYISAFLCAAIYGGFFMTLMCIGLFDGKTHDENGYLPTEINLAGKTFFLDANVTVFSAMVALLAIALYLLPEL